MEISQERSQTAPREKGAKREREEDDGHGWTDGWTYVGLTAPVTLKRFAIYSWGKGGEGGTGAKGEYSHGVSCWQFSLGRAVVGWMFTNNSKKHLCAKAVGTGLVLSNVDQCV